MEDPKLGWEDCVVEAVDMAEPNDEEAADHVKWLGAIFTAARARLHAVKEKKTVGAPVFG